MRIMRRRRRFPASNRGSLSLYFLCLNRQNRFRFIIQVRSDFLVSMLFIQWMTRIFLSSLRNDHFRLVRMHFADIIVILGGILLFFSSIVLSIFLLGLFS